METVNSLGNGRYKGQFLFWIRIWNIKVLCDYWDLFVNTDNQIVTMAFESVSNLQFLLDADKAEEYINQVADAITEQKTSTNIKDTLELDIPIENIYVNADGNIVVVNTNPDGSISETVLGYGSSKDGAGTVIVDKEGNTYEITTDENNATVNIARETETVNYTEHRQDSTISEEKIDAFKNRIIAELIRDIKIIDIGKYTGKEKEYIEGSINNVEYLYNTAMVTETYLGATGWYKDGKLFVKYTGNENEDDVKVTLFHEYLHHINYSYKIYEYRYENENKREIYTIKDTCFTYREVSMDDVYEIFLYSNTAVSFDDWAFKYADLTIEQKQQVIEYKDKHKDWFENKQCYSGRYQPSNYYRDEIMVRKVCFKLNNIIFNMTEEKISQYEKDIDDYKTSIANAEKYELKKYLNERGYEK
jgi:hypothetical protein